MARPIENIEVDLSFKEESFELFTALFKENHKIETVTKDKILNYITTLDGISASVSSLRILFTSKGKKGRANPELLNSICSYLHNLDYQPYISSSITQLGSMLDGEWYGINWSNSKSRHLLISKINFLNTSKTDSRITFEKTGKNFDYIGEVKFFKNRVVTILASSNDHPPYIIYNFTLPEQNGDPISLIISNYYKATQHSQTSGFEIFIKKNSLSEEIETGSYEYSNIPSELGPAVFYFLYNSLDITSVDQETYGMNDLFITDKVPEILVTAPHNPMDEGPDKIRTNVITRVVSDLASRLSQNKDDVIWKGFSKSNGINILTGSNDTTSQFENRLKARIHLVLWPRDVPMDSESLGEIIYRISKSKPLLIFKESTIFPDYLDTIIQNNPLIQVFPVNSIEDVANMISGDFKAL